MVCLFIGFRAGGIAASDFGTGCSIDRIKDLFILSVGVKKFCKENLIYVYAYFL